MERLSKFPEEIDSFKFVSDLPPSKVSKASRLQELKQKPTLNATDQQELNTLALELDPYIITPTTWNKFGESLVGMQTFMKNEVDGYIQSKQEEWADYVKDFHYVGVHSKDIAYEFQNQVKSSGDLYLAIQDVPIGIEISNVLYWQKISTKGDKGDVGLNTHLKGAYNASSVYAIGDAVVYDGNIYYCIATTTAGILPTNASYWYLYDNVFISSTEPSIAQSGLIWIELED